MDIPDEIVNQATARALRGVMSDSGLNQKSWAAKSGMSLTTLQKLLSGNQAVKIPQMLALAHASDLSVEEVADRIDRAVQRAVSEAPPSLDAHRKTRSPQHSPAEMTLDEIDEQQQAAGHDPELEAPEPEHP